MTCTDLYFSIISQQCFKALCTKRNIISILPVRLKTQFYEIVRTECLKQFTNQHRQPHLPWLFFIVCTFMLVVMRLCNLLQKLYENGCMAHKQSFFLENILLNSGQRVKSSLIFVGKEIDHFAEFIFVHSYRDNLTYDSCICVHKGGGGSPWAESFWPPSSADEKKKERENFSAKPPIFWGFRWPCR